MAYPLSRLRRLSRAMLLCVLVLLLLWGAMVALLRPTNDRDWSPDQAELATAVIEGDQVEISNVRNALYRSTTDYDVRWEQRRYDLGRLESVWFMVEPFSDWRGPAHTLLSFGFSDGGYLAVSVEIRKEQGEAFSPLKGLLRQYELTYIIGDERDLIGLRANHRRDEVFLYPIHTTRAGRRALLVSMLERANAVAAQPEFYNTLSNTCTTNIVNHIEAIVPGRIPFSYKTLLPGYSDELAFDLGLIDTTLSREHFRAAHRINDLALEHADSESFSAGIRARSERH
jgi:hypothetical protein